MTRSTKKRTRRSLRRNPLSTKQKLLAVSGLAVVGGVAAYALTRGSTAAGGGGGSSTGTGTPTGADIAAQCTTMQTQLATMRAAAHPDPAAMQRLESQIAACIAQARAAGGSVDDATSDLSSGDGKYQHIEDQFADYKRTEYSDALKRNNVRQDMLNTGQSMAADYLNAVNATLNSAATRVVRQSILRALDAAVLRRLCYLYDQPGCGRFGVNEDHGNDKAAQEYARVIKPLLDAQAAAVQKLWNTNPADATAADTAAFFATQLRPCTALNDYVNAKFAEYKTVDYSDAVRRNNLRIGEVLAKSGDLVACLQDVVGDAIGYKSLPALRLATALVRSALDAATTRWLCFITVSPGCDRFGVNEDDSNTKAGQEYERTIAPLSALYMGAAAQLVSWGDVTAYEPLIALKLRRCSGLNDFVNSKFAEYKSVDYSDAVRRNNLRQVVLAIGGLLAACLQDAMGSALTGAAARPSSLVIRAALAANVSALKLPFMLFSATGTPAPTGTSGLGLTLASAALLKPVLTQPMTILPAKPTTTSTTPAVDLGVQGAVDAGVRMVTSVMGVAKTALDAAITRQLCYLYAQPGCDRFGVNEDAGVDKAGQEYATTVSPIMAVVAQGTNFLVGTGDPKAETALISSKLRYCTALSDYVNAKFAEYRSVSWSDAVRRNNLRVNEVMGKGRDLVTCLRNTAPTTALGRAMVKAVADAAWQSSMDRMNCYLDSSSNCGRFGANEDDNATKADQEHADIFVPLGDIRTRLAGGQPLSGLGLALDTGTWWQLGAAVLIGGLLVASTTPRKKMQRNRTRRRRTSRRAR